MDATSLLALSPLDGRYARKAAPLREYLSEYALIRYRTLIEVRWLQHLADEPSVPDVAPLEPPIKDVLNQIVDEFSIDDATRIKALEAKTNHDVKAVEYYLRAEARRRRRCNPAISSLSFTSPAPRRTSTTWRTR